ncbi:MAG: hypothetical protein E7338_05200, partial [Clostridiales bacterium]|nr:hypothetical protein [Clostridiales bacterium]
MKRGLTIILAIALMAILIIPVFGCEKKVEIPDGINLSIMSFNIRQDTATDTGVRDWDARKEYLINHMGVRTYNWTHIKEENVCTTSKLDKTS